MEEQDVREALAFNLKRLRGQRGLSQLKLAGELHMAFTFINDIENCRKWVSPDTLARFATFFGVSVSELFIDESKSASDNSASMIVAALSDEIHKTINDVSSRFGINV